MPTLSSPRAVLRAMAALMASTVIALWVLLLFYLYREAGWMPAPALFTLPIFFFSLAIWGLLAAIRDEPVKLVMAGLLSFLPIGLYLLFMPGFARWIGILNLGMVGIGATLLRSSWDAD